MTLHDSFNHFAGFRTYLAEPCSRAEGRHRNGNRYIHAGFVRKPVNGGVAIVAYAGVFLGYTIIFVISLFTVGFLEIRQANMSDFNALIAVLEERDGYADGHLDDPLKRVQAEREFAYWASVNLDCRDSSSATDVKQIGRVTRPAMRRHRRRAPKLVPR